MTCAVRRWCRLSGNHACSDATDPVHPGAAAVAHVIAGGGGERAVPLHAKPPVHDAVPVSLCLLRRPEAGARALRRIVTLQPAE